MQTSGESRMPRIALFLFCCYVLPMLVHPQGTCTVDYPSVEQHIRLSSGYSMPATQIIIPEATFTQPGRITSWTMAVACNSASGTWSTKLQVWAREGGNYVLRHSEDVFLSYTCNNNVETFRPKTLYFQTGDVLGVYTVHNSQNYIQMGYRNGASNVITRYLELRNQPSSLNSVALSRLEEQQSRTPLISIEVCCNCSEVATTTAATSTPTTSLQNTPTTLGINILGTEDETSLLPSTSQATASMGAHSTHSSKGTSESSESSSSGMISTPTPGTITSPPDKTKKLMIIIGVLATIIVLTILAIAAITAGVCVKKKCMTTIERGESKADSGVDDTYEEVDSFVERQITMERNPVYAHITLNPLKQEQDVSDAVDTASMQSSESTSDYVDVSQSESDSESYEERVTIERSPAYSSVSNPPQLNRTQIQGATIEQYLVISNSPGLKGSTDDECTDCSNEPGYYGTYITLST